VAEGRVKMVEPALTALLGGPAVDVVGDVGPVSRLCRLLRECVALLCVVGVEVTVEGVIFWMEGFHEMRELGVL